MRNSERYFWLCPASGSGSEDEEEDEEEDGSSSQSEGEEEEGEEESVSGSGRSGQSAGKKKKLTQNQRLWQKLLCHVSHDGSIAAVSFATEDVSEEEHSEDDYEEERENGNHIPAGEKDWKTIRPSWRSCSVTVQHSHAHYCLAVPESRFDHDTEESGEDMDDEEDDEEEDEEEEDEAGEEDATPPTQTHSPAAEENYIPDSPPISPVELKKELPKYLPALQVRPGSRRSPGAGGAVVLRMPVFSAQGCRSVEEFQCLNRIEEGTYGVVYRAKDKKTGMQKVKQCHPLF